MGWTALLIRVLEILMSSGDSSFWQLLRWIIFTYQMHSHTKCTLFAMHPLRILRILAATVLANNKMKKAFNYVFDWCASHPGHIAAFCYDAVTSLESKCLYNQYSWQRSYSCFWSKNTKQTLRITKSMQLL